MKYRRPHAPVFMIFFRASVGTMRSSFNASILTANHRHISRKSSRCHGTISRFGCIELVNLYGLRSKGLAGSAADMAALTAPAGSYPILLHLSADSTGLPNFSKRSPYPSVPREVPL